MAVGMDIDTLGNQKIYPTSLSPKIYIHRPSPSAISCCSTIEYTLALRRVKTVAVFLSSPRSASRISTEGLAERSAKIAESWLS
jgi:hypothetical protein